MDDASGQLGNNGTEIGYLVSGKNGVRFAISKVAELPPRGAVIQPVTQFVLHALRERLIEKFAAYMQHAEAFQVAIALIFGYRSQIDNTTLQAFSNTGTIHVLSVSGLHVGLVFVLLSFVLRWMDFFRYGRIIRCIIICLAVWVYVVLTGMAPPILRAGIMITFFLLSTAIGRKQVPLNTLATSALFILLF